MTSAEITNLLDAQIGDQWHRTNLHGVDLRKCIVPPERKSVLDAAGEKSCEAWLVLLEHPDKKLGYAVVYDETSGDFGLAQFAEGYEPCLFGLYGDFFKALEAM